MKINIREQLNISRLAIKYPRLTIAFWIGVAVAGILALSSLKYALFPEITFPVVVVNAQTPIATALATEDRLTQLLEKPLDSLEKVRDISSMTYPGRTVINVLFDIGDNLETSTESVRKELAKLALPPNTTYEVIPVNLNESPVISYALNSQTKSIGELSEISENIIIPKLKALPGVLKVNLLGNTTVATDRSATQFPTLVRFNQQDSLALQVVKTSQTNTLEVVSQVEKAVQTLQPQLSNIQLTLAETQAGFIREATKATIDDLLLAIVLSILVVFPFLRSFRATMITALAIPLSLLGTCIVMAIFGFNLETITLLALALVIGIVIDDAIVDVENIARHIEEGNSPKEAAIIGTDEIGLSVTAATITIAAVFIPVAFMGGAIGKFFKPFGLTVSAAVLISLLVARTLSPVLAVYWLKPRRNINRPQADDRNWIVAQKYRNLLEWSLHHRKIVIGLAILSFMIGISLIPLIPKGFMPQLDRGEFNVVYTVPLPKLSVISKPDNISNSQPPSSGAFDWISEIAKSPESIILRRTQRVGERIEAAVFKSPDVASVFMVSGIQGTPNRGKLYVTLKHQRQLTTAEVQEQVRQNLPKLKGVAVSVEDLPFVQTEAEKPLQIALRGQDLPLLYKSAENLKNQISQLPGFEDVDLSSKLSDTGEIIQIERLDGENTVFLSANLSNGQGLEDATQIVENTAKSILPSDITLQRWGSSSQSSDVLNSFGRTITLSIILMLLILLALFKRFLEPLVVGLSLPLSIVGAMLGLLITQSAFGIISLIGLIFLVGLLDKNAVLLMDYINQLRKKGINREEAILETGIVRLRPIIMTTASTILGMLPIALGLGTGAELRQPMAVAIVGGLLTSSLLSLIVVPVLYTVLEDFWSKISRKKTI